MTNKTESNVEIVHIQQESQPMVSSSNNADTMLNIIERIALNPNADISKLEKFLEMRNQEIKRNAEQLFFKAFSDMQPHLPPIPADGKGHNNTRYPKKETMNRLVIPILQEYGFSISFTTTQISGFITIRATLAHREGHYVFTELTLPQDKTGNKSEVQQIGSSQSYGERYTMKGILNLTIIKDPTDDDGALSQEQRKKSSFAESVASDTKKNNKSPIKEPEAQKEPLWDKKTIYLLDNKNITCEFKSSDDAGHQLLKELGAYQTKSQRLAVMKLNMPIMRALIKKGNGTLIDSLHKFVDEGK